MENNDPVLQTILQAVHISKFLGVGMYRWSRIAAQLPGRTDNEIKNYWNTRLKKRLRSQGLDPATHLPLDSSASKGGTGGDEDDDDDSSDDVASATNSGSGARLAKKKAATPAPKIEPPPKVRQPKGPKPQLKMCQSKEGQLVLLTAPASSRKLYKSGCKSDDSSGSTVTAEAAGHHESSQIARKLTTAPSFPQSELWKCVKPVASNNNNTNTPFAAASELLNEWDSYIMQSGIQGACNSFAQVPGEMELDSWTMNTEIGSEIGSETGTEIGTDIMSQPAPECMFAPISVSSNPCGFGVPELPLQHTHQPSQELQRLAKILDLI